MAGGIQSAHAASNAVICRGTEHCHDVSRWPALRTYNETAEAVSSRPLFSIGEMLSTGNKSPSRPFPVRRTNVRSLSLFSVMATVAFAFSFFVRSRLAAW